MKIKLIAKTIIAFSLSVSAYAQGQPDVHKAKIRPTPEERSARQLDRKDKLDKMTPAERKAYRQAHYKQRQARMSAMTPKQKAKKEERRRIRKEVKQTEK